MNNYPEWWNSTITVYNRFIDPTTYVVRWFKTFINGAFWKSTGNKVTINDVVIDTDNIICRIRKDDRFLPKGEWIAQPNDHMSDYFTLAKGDIIIRGEVLDDIDEYTTGHHSNDVLNKYKEFGECLVIQQVSNNTGDGLGQEHYYVRGV